MSDFEVGDAVYWINCNKGDCSLELDSLTIFCDKVTNSSGGWIWVRDTYPIYGSDAFKTKQECIDAFKKRLDEL